LEEAVQTELRAAGRSRVDEYPRVRAVFFLRVAFGMFLWVSAGRPVESGLDVLADEVGFANPGALGVWHDHRDDVSGFLQGVDEG
jgi:hypothetical protein